MKTIALSTRTDQGTYKVANIGGPQASRLLEMGITPGCQLQVIRFAPTGFPLEVKVRGYLLSLRKQEADGIYIEE